MKRLEKNILPIIKVALKEDIGRGDITSQLTIPAKKRIKASILIKENGIICGLHIARLTFKSVDRKIQFRTAVKEGTKVEKGRIVARLQGNARGILKAERVALNFLGRLSGIATLTSQYIRHVKPFKVKIMDTRKSTPTLRLLERYAVRCGGGINHRMGLWDQVLVKDNHWLVTRRWSLVSSLKELIEQIKDKSPKGMKIEVEVKNLRQFKQVLAAKPDIIMLDNFSMANIRKAVWIRNHSPFTIHHSPKLEVSGGVNLNNVRKIASCGVERISVGELTHSAKALDVALNCE